MYNSFKFKLVPNYYPGFQLHITCGLQDSHGSFWRGGSCSGKLSGNGYPRNITGTRVKPV